ncbi:MAG TPA: site-2 protease family protein [Vicinamibacterales bacterium]|nr:site-2 protease family protein [Vicinamibacterales bacterium]
MGPSSQQASEFPLPPFADPDEPFVLSAPVYVPPREPRLRYIILFLLTLLSTTFVGGLMHWASFISPFSPDAVTASPLNLFLHGFWYSASILGILGAHEFGHYYACLYYRVDSSLPYFLPVPPPFFTGTLGAVIRIRQPIPGKRALFDIGIAGPIAGFVVAVPLLLIGMHLSTVVQVPHRVNGDIIELGEPLLFKAATWLTFGHVPDGYTVNMHPMAFAAWFGLLATALNLFPIGQLDGGHISYAVLGRRSTMVTFVMVACLIGLTFVSASWIVWTVLTVGMLVVFGPRHPRTYDEEIPLDATRMWLAAFAVLMFVLCFTPSPIQASDILGR